ncbi:D-tyrosyl-tRNA(Tyr) deacylase [Methylacidiphilum sp. Yel]|jgi:D-tyrosyl-tRNA(Tyr) deacylase|uniref:D-aminoacyl-tRNA deacylase n=1 Tax=Methylacidiphilum sp. Yel TaxID=1847730 RepID=UPI001068F00A|nr:D-aminoacyl-tRNA deacylase [Methylacidiphilum sp. Yel]TFE69209.1 D-tyrosyl-tRNA(Tyr) deacylase [Methylacidiphilum sp. Yel]
MIGLIQRVKEAAVKIEDRLVSSIGRGILLFLAVEKEDEEKKADQMIEKILHCRIFPDENGKMNRSLLDINGELLIIPEFTLAGEFLKGKRPSFHHAAPPEEGKILFDYLVERAKSKHGLVKKGCFRANMTVYLINEGPVSFWIRT